MNELTSLSKERRSCTDDSFVLFSLVSLMESSIEGYKVDMFEPFESKVDEPD